MLEQNTCETFSLLEQTHVKLSFVWKNTCETLFGRTNTCETFSLLEQTRKKRSIRLNKHT